MSTYEIPDDEMWNDEMLRCEEESSCGREDAIEQWMMKTWSLSKKNTGAIFLNTSGWNVCIRETKEHRGEWEWRIGQWDSDNYDYSRQRYKSEIQAKRAVLEELANKLGYS